MKNLVSFIFFLFLAVFVSGCGTKYARPDRCVCKSESFPKIVEQESKEKVVVQEPEPEPKPKEIVAVTQVLQEAVKSDKKEFTLDFEKIIKQSLFKSGSDKISIETYESLNTVAIFLKRNPNISLKIEGHTDNTGSKKFNQILSEKRAKVTANYLIEKGVESGRISTKGYGLSKSIATNKIKEGRAKNRRTELKFSIM